MMLLSILLTKFFYMRIFSCFFSKKSKKLFRLNDRSLTHHVSRIFPARLLAYSFISLFSIFNMDH